jgi:hypothetical protein
MTPPGIGKKNPTYGNLLPTQYQGCGSIVQCGARARDQYVNDVIQGASLDCYFMAALYSVIMTYYWAHPVSLSADINGYYTIPFYTYPGNRAKVSKKVKPRFPLTAAPAQQIVYAQLTPDHSETWVALYEKAYAKFLGYDNDTLPGFNKLPGYVSGDDPDIGLLPQNYAMDPLTQLTKLLPSENPVPQTGGILLPPTIYNPTNLGGWQGQNYASSYQVLNKQNFENGLTHYATVAWTYADATQIVPPGVPALYDTDVLVPSHAYSLLGLYSNANKDYIVLRNPWGNMINPANLTAGLLKDSLASGTWSPTGSPQVTFGNAADGIFGLEKGIFDTCFEGFGWVQFTAV